MSIKAYQTSDLYYAAYLKVAHVPFVEAVREPTGRVVFVFECVEGLRELKNKFFSRTALVSAMDYADEVKALKALMFNT